MLILKIIHGYPPRYNAGSEVYSQMLCRGLADRHTVHVFTREEDPFKEDFALQLERDCLDPRITLHLINIPGDKHRYRYRHSEVDQKLANLLDHLKPDIVHIGHLNHLSTSLIYEIANRKIPIVYTLHDYWLMCPRGQFIQRRPAEPKNLWALCDKQDHKKCATHCYAGYFSGNKDEQVIDIAYWANWVARRMRHIREITSLINCFIAPSMYLYNRFINEFGLPKDKILHLSYGYDLQRYQNKRRSPGEPFTFGYIGTHTPAKGIQLLIRAFSLLKGDCKLRIWGRPTALNTAALKNIIAELPLAIQTNIEWRGEYINDHITPDVFNHVDAIVIPSIWVENSPLVIHEALQARVPVITADVGGMAEYIQHGKNGLLFKHRDAINLSVQMQHFIDHPELAQQFGQQGYLHSTDSNIPSLNQHIATLEFIYRQLLAKEDISICA
jgi:glycosyltransferase involved in cell wall biosynthesis